MLFLVIIALLENINPLVVKVLALIACLVIMLELI
jgi:hypothetical protein